MIRGFQGSKLGALLLCSLTWTLAACAPLRRSVPAEALPRRMVLALDGVDYRDVLDARQRGRFAAFHPPARLVSTFPSISDIAWHAILGVQPPAGYQRVYYSTRQKAVLGDALSSIRPIEYEERMDYAFDTKFHHLGAYLMSWPVARREVDADVEHVLRTRNRETVYLYNVGPDALQHTRGDVARYLDHLSERLDTLQARYGRRTGRTLEMVLLSDHGHNRARDAAFIPISESLAAHGFEVARKLAAPNHVAFSVDGVTTGFGVFCDPDSVERVAALLTAVEGVELVTARVGNTRFRIQARALDGSVQLAHLDWRPATPAHGNAAQVAARFRYETERGDPLVALPIIERMREAGALDAEGFASEEAWAAHSSMAKYPAAVVRIVHGHVHATRNPAPILVSVLDSHRVGLGMVSVANRLRPLGGTHGALGETNALGVVLSNGVAPHDDVAWRVREQFGGFDDLKTPAVPGRTVSVVSSADLRRDRFAQRSWVSWQTVPDSVPLVVLALRATDLRPGNDSVWVRFEVRERDRSEDDGRVVRSTALPLADGWRNTEQPLRAWLASDAGLTELDPRHEHSLRVLIEYRQFRAGVMETVRSQTLLKVVLRVASDGTPWSY
ncbi:hypothetical protein [Gemmatimonas sp.]